MSSPLIDYECYFSCFCLFMVSTEVKCFDKKPKKTESAGCCQNVTPQMRGAVLKHPE